MALDHLHRRLHGPAHESLVHELTAWNFSRGHVIGAVVMLVVLLVAGRIGWWWLNRPFQAYSRREWAAERRAQEAHWNRVYRGGGN